MIKGGNDLRDMPLGAHPDLSQSDNYEEDYDAQEKYW